MNTSQRIQTEAEPGQIVVSEDVARGLRSRPAFRFEPLGERALKGVAPMELFLVVGVESSAGDGSTAENASGAPPSCSTRGRPRACLTRSFTGSA